MVGRLLLLTCALGWSATAFASAPTCDELVAALPTALQDAREVVVAVSVEQGGREIAFERSRILREPDGSTSTTTLEQRGLRRPGGAGGEAPGGPGGGAPGGDAFALPCDDHELDMDGDGQLHLSLRDPDPDAPVAEWSLRFDYADGRWRPLELIAPFTVRVLFVPVRGRFVTSFEGWQFDDP